MAIPFLYAMKDLFSQAFIYKVSGNILTSGDVDTYPVLAKSIYNAFFTDFIKID